MSFVVGLCVGAFSTFLLLLILALIFEMPDKKKLLVLLERILRKMGGELDD